MPLAQDRSGSPFSLAPAQPHPLAQGIVSLAERALGLLELDRLYGDFQTLPGSPWDAALEVLQLRLDVSGTIDLPPEGPLVVVANHPLGGLDGVALLKLLKPLRPDTLLVADPVLWRMPELRPHLLGTGADAPRSGDAGFSPLLRQALRHLRKGGCLACFPAGPASGPVEPAWSPAVARLAQRSGATVVPLWFEADDKLPARLLHPSLHAALLAKNVLGRQGSTLRVAAGSRIPAFRLAPLGGEQAIQVIRGQASVLAGRLAAPARKRAGVVGAPKGPAPEPLAAPQDPAALAREIAALPPEQLMASGGGLQVWVARAPQLPHLLQELGLERERAFRAVGEGTGRGRDLDRYDEWYLHLLLWDPARQCLAGGYRMGPTDEILARRGKAGLYTMTLFHMSSWLLRQLDPALEMGRSFLREGYLGTHGPLMLLWKGIGRWLQLNPRYRRLFGPVSISDDYQPMSRTLIARWASRHLKLEGSSLLRVMPRRPFLASLKGEARRLPGQLVDFDALDEAVRLIEGDKGVPVLFKHYAKLGGRFAGFNFDPAFGDCLDGLVVVDLARTDPRLLGMYMGRAEAKAYQAFHLGVAPQGEVRARA
jgi:putative hemolysin